VARFDRLLRTGLGSAGTSDAHLDADQISAFVENGVGRAMVLEHAGRCAECREALFLLSGERLSPAPARVWRWAWIPAAAAVCALGVVLPMFLHRGPRPSVAVIAKAPPPPQIRMETETVPEHSPLPIKPALKKAAIPEPSRSRQDEERIPSVVQAEPAMAAPPPPKLAEADQLKAVEQSPSASRTQQTSTAQVTSQQQDALRQFNQQPAQSAKRPPSAGISFFNPQQASASQKSRVEPRSMKAVIPARPRQWAINQGIPEQSGDAGLSWRQMPIDASIRFQAIENLADDVWAGGSGGVLVHSNDSGEHWQRVKVVDGGQTLTSDVIGLRVITRLEIHILSTSGEQWATHDGGQSWKREQ
jgi:hypothetical protein